MPFGKFISNFTTEYAPENMVNILRYALSAMSVVNYAQKQKGDREWDIKSFIMNLEKVC